MTPDISPADSPGAAARYQALEAARRPYLDRAREAARLTTPGLLPPLGHGGGQALPTPYQGVGARGVNALAAKLLLAQFPPGAPFFRLTVDQAALRRDFGGGADEAEAVSSEAAEAAVETALAKMERAVLSEIEGGFLRAGLHAAIKQLIVAGNCLVHVIPEGGLRVFRLDRYVVKRDPMGAVREIVVKESVAPDALPEDALAPALGRRGAATAETVDLYTWIRREPDGWSVAQEANGRALPGSAGRYPPGRLDWLALRWSAVDGEDYGRGHVEEQIGDLKSLEGLMQAVVEGSAAAARMIVLVAPNGQTDAEELAEAENGAIIDGQASDVSILQAGKQGDFRVAFEAIKTLTERLSFAFLLGEAARRQADRVTAEEVRLVAAELENALGGVYSVLAEELQKPLVELILHHKAQAGLLPPPPDGVIRPEIVTGLDAMGRGRDLARLEAFLGFVTQIGKLAETPMAAQLDLDRILAQAAAAIGVAGRDLIRPEASIGASAALGQMVERLGPALQALAKGAEAEDA